MRRSSTVFLAVCLALGLAQISAIVVGPASKDPDSHVLARICKTKDDKQATYCWPRSHKQYVKCANGKGTLHSCPPGNAYDYVARVCVSAKSARRCPNLQCPVSLAGLPPVQPNATHSPLKEYGQFGAPGNVTLPFNKPGKYRVFCPTYGHCEGGMSFLLTVVDEPNASPMVVDVGKINEWAERIREETPYPPHLKDLTIKKGDSLYIDWDEPIHFVGVYDLNTRVKLPYVPYPPQPTYKCPAWTILPNFTIPMVPGETRLVDLVLPSPPMTEYTWTATQKGDLFFACSLPYHCRLGMIFRTTVKPASMKYVPKTHTVQWVMDDYENFKDMTIKVGDKIKFVWGGMQPVHMLSILKNVEKY